MDRMLKKEIICPICCPAKSLAPCATDGCNLLGTPATFNLCGKCYNQYMDQEMERVVESVLEEEYELVNVNPTPRPTSDDFTSCVGDPLCAHGCGIFFDYKTCFKCFGDYADQKMNEAGRLRNLVRVLGVETEPRPMWMSCYVGGCRRALLGTASFAYNLSSNCYLGTSAVFAARGQRQPCPPSPVTGISEVDEKRSRYEILAEDYLDRLDRLKSKILSAKKRSNRKK